MLSVSQLTELSSSTSLSLLLFFFLFLHCRRNRNKIVSQAKIIWRYCVLFYWMRFFKANLFKLANLSHRFLCRRLLKKTFTWFAVCDLIRGPCNIKNVMIAESFPFEIIFLTSNSGWRQDIMSQSRCNPRVNVSCKTGGWPDQHAKISVLECF